MIQVFIGTKAQYIKTAPLLRLMDEGGIEYRLIDSGQHAQISRKMRLELGVREPDVALGGDRDIATIRAAVAWSMGLARRLVSRAELRREVFGGRGGICVVHGDTPSTLLSAALAWRAGLKVAHLEAGLRSRSLFHPFPEELIRIVVMRVADICFAPTPDAVDNLRRMRRRGGIVELEGNTSVEAVSHVVDGREHTADGPALVTMHRVENLRNRRRTEGWIRAVERIAARYPVRFVMHEPTRLVLEPSGGLDRLEAAGVEISPLLGHREFIELLQRAPLALIDGGSIQEECAYLGVPTLLWRSRTERPHGLGDNIELAHYEQATVKRFLETLDARRRPQALPAAFPSRQILDELLMQLGRPNEVAQPRTISSN